MATGIDNYKHFTLKSLFNEFKKLIKKQEVPVGKVFENFEKKGPMEEYATMDQKFQWGQNMESGLIEKEVGHLTRQ